MIERQNGQMFPKGLKFLLEKMNDDTVTLNHDIFKFVLETIGQVEYFVSKDLEPLPDEGEADYDAKVEIVNAENEKIERE